MGDQVLVASCVGTFFALDRETGSERWQFDIRPSGGQQFHDEMLVVDDRVIIGTDGRRGNVHALSIGTGEELWMRACGKEMRTDLRRVGDTVIGIAKHEDRDVLFCTRIEDGTDVWTVERSSSGKDDRIYPGAVLIDDGAGVCVGRSDGVVLAYDTRDGTLLWETKVGGAMSTALLLHDGHLYGGTKTGTIFRIDLESRIVDASIDVGGKPGRALRVMNGLVGVLLDWRTPESRLVMLDEDLAEVAWEWTATSETDFGTVARLYQFQNTVLIGTQQGHILARDLGDGSPAWHAKVEGAVRSLNFGGETLLVGTIPGPLYAAKLH